MEANAELSCDTIPNAEQVLLDLGGIDADPPERRDKCENCK